MATCPTADIFVPFMHRNLNKYDLVQLLIDYVLKAESEGGLGALDDFMESAAADQPADWYGENFPTSIPDGRPPIAVVALLIRMALDRQVLLPTETVIELQRLHYLPHDWHVWTSPIKINGMDAYLVAHPYQPKPDPISTLVSIVKVPLPPEE